jgi:hypothetical protein
MRGVMSQVFLAIVLAVIIAFTFLYAVDAFSDDTGLPLREMPAGQVINSQGTQYKMFTLAEYKQLAEMYVDYHALYVQNKSLQKEVTLRLDVEKNYALQVENLKSIVKIYEADRLYWVARLNEEQAANKRRETLSGLERFGAWALVAVEAVALGTLGVIKVTQ